MRIHGAAIRRRGFTISEIALASVLMALLGILLAQAWTVFGRPAISAIARARLAQEANLAAESLARDVGLLAAPTGTQTDSRYQNAIASGSTLYLTLDEGGGTVSTINYSLDPSDSSRLIRSDANGNSRVIATLVQDFQCSNATLQLMEDGTSVSGVQILLTLQHRTYDRDTDGTYQSDHTRQYTLFIPDSQ